MKKKCVLILHKLTVIESSKFKNKPLSFLLINSNIHLQTAIFVSPHSAVYTYFLSSKKSELLFEGDNT